MRPETVRRHRSAISRALTFITDRDEETLCLERIADVAAMSPFHFEHVYESYVGEPVMKTVRHRKLRLAQFTLQKSDRKVSAVGEAAGYSSGQAFARALKRATGVTPSDVRRGNTMAMTAPEIQFARLEERPVHGIPLIGNYSDEAEAFNELVGHAYANVDIRSISSHRRDVRGITVLPEAWPCGAQSSQRVVTVTADNMPRQYGGQTVPGGEYAVIRHFGSLSDAGEAIRMTRERILCELGLVATDRPMLCEWIADAALLPRDQFVLDIFLPISS